MHRLMVVVQFSLDLNYTTLMAEPAIACIYRPGHRLHSECMLAR
jgi:hypothetical protein